MLKQKILITITMLSIAITQSVYAMDIPSDNIFFDDINLDTSEDIEFEDIETKETDCSDNLYENVDTESDNSIDLVFEDDTDIDANIEDNSLDTIEIGQYETMSNIASGSCGTTATYALDANGTLVIAGSGGVTSAPWLSKKDDIKKIVMNDNITEVCANAFKGCKNLTSVTLSKKLSVLNYGLFSNCTSLTQINIPDSVVTISYPLSDAGVEGTFNGCTALSNVKLSNNTKIIGSNAFYGCTSLAQISIPQSVEQILTGAFRVTGLTFVTIPNKVTEIGESAFASSSLRSILFNEGLTNIGANAFYNNQALESVSFPSTLKNIGEYAFHNCTNLSEVTLNQGLLSINNEAFALCTSLRGILIPSTVTKVCTNAFGGDLALDKIAFLNKNCEISSSIFANNEYITPVVFGIKNSTAMAFAISKGLTFKEYDAEEYEDYDSTVTKYDFTADLNGLPSNYKLVQDYTVVLNKKKLAAGATASMSFSITDNSYKVKSVKMNGKDACAFLIGKTQGYYSFTMPARPVVLTINFEPNYAGTPTDEWRYSLEEIDYHDTVTIGDATRDMIFNFGGAEYITPYTVNKNGTLKLATKKTMKREGYDFKGWYTDAGKKKTTITRKDLLLGNTRVTAKWTDHTYSIIYKTNNMKGGKLSSKIKNQSKRKYSENVVINGTDVTYNKKNGEIYNLIGWSATKDGTTIDYELGQTVSRLTSKKGGKITLYAVWERANP